MEPIKTGLLIAVVISLIAAKICSYLSRKDRQKWTEGKWTLESCQRAIAWSKRAYYLCWLAFILGLTWLLLLW